MLVETLKFSGIVQYHERTKHHFHRYARSLGYMDWKNQPHPFRFYSGGNETTLPLLKDDPSAGQMHLYQRKNKDSGTFCLKNVAGFLELSLGLSAWKSYAGNSWSLRINPSSGNLHPTECHVVLPSMHSLQAGVYHYCPFSHSLELRAEVSEELWERVRNHFGVECFVVGLSSIYWRESWKYGERAFRYCSHDIGHALACLCFSASLQGWRVKYLNALSDDDVENILGLNRVKWNEEEEEHPESLCVVYSDRVNDIMMPRFVPSDVISTFSELDFKGEPNPLSDEKTHWEVIREASNYTRKPATTETRYHFGRTDFFEHPSTSFQASMIIRKRRSAVGFDGEGVLARNQFLSILDKTLPRDDCAPFDAEIIEPAIHLLIFVHRVHDLEPGLYFLIRNVNDMDEIRELSRSKLLWERADTELPLYLLEKGDFRQIAIRVSCEQEIAGYGIFSLGMIARFEGTLKEGAYKYRHLHWEAGMVGQILYLEAEACGVRGTGIGCFFDDPVHDLLGLEGNTYQSLYHFTVGSPVEDRRLTTFSPYSHLSDGR